jgi:hypothetical protein
VLLPPLHTRPHSVFEKNVWMISLTPSKEGEHRALANPKLVALTLQVLILIIKRLKMDKIRNFKRFKIS